MGKLAMDLIEAEAPRCPRRASMQAARQFVGIAGPVSAVWPIQGLIRHFRPELRPGAEMNSPIQEAAE